MRVVFGRNPDALSGADVNEQQKAITAQSVEFERVAKGEPDGHPFRGNQYTDGASDGGDKKPKYPGGVRVSPNLVVYPAGATQMEEDTDEEHQAMDDDAEAWYPNLNHISARAARLVATGTPMRKALAQAAEEYVAYLKGENPAWESVFKGEGPGHPFRGNQYTDGESGDSAQSAGAPPANWLGTVRGMTNDRGQTLRQLLDEKADVATIATHPAFAQAYEISQTIPKTNQQPGYLTEEWKAERRFDITDKNGNRVASLIGYPAGIDYLNGVAADYAGPGGVKYEKTATIMLGPPASGKSFFAESIASATGSVIVDPDDAKKILPEFYGGIGADAVHEESSHLAGEVMSHYVQAGANLVFPKVGGEAKSVAKIKSQIAAFQAHGYKVNIVNVGVDEGNAFRRAVGRFLNSGRLISYDYTKAVDGNPARTYADLKTAGLNSYVNIDANGVVGKHVVTEGSETAIGKIVTGLQHRG